MVRSLGWTGLPFSGLRGQYWREGYESGPARGGAVEGGGGQEGRGGLALEGGAAGWWARGLWTE